MDIYVGSTSVHKISAVKDACQDIFPQDINVQGIKAASGINEQPVGQEETLQGALNRLAAVKQTIHGTRYDLVAAFEGGIFPVNVGGEEAWFDIGWAIVEDADGNRAITHSAGIQLDPAAVKEARRKGFDTTTVGSILAAQTGADGTDPHEYVTKGLLVRSDLLQQSLKAAIGQLLHLSQKLRDLKQ